MKEKIKNIASNCTYVDWALLYMRVFIGGILLMHNIGKLQIYNEIVNYYPQISGLSSAATLVVISVVEVVCAALIIIGIRVRAAATVMAVGMFLSMLFFFTDKGIVLDELQFVYMGIYIFLIISGGGTFSYDNCRECPDEQ